MLSSITRERGIDKEIFLIFHWEQGLVVKNSKENMFEKKKLMEYKMELKRRSRNINLKFSAPSWTTVKNIQ